jgi:hypothetical protein
MPKNTEFALAELERRWRGIFTTLAAGGEVAPAERLRTEGFMEALVTLGLASEPALQSALESCYLECFGEALPQDWRTLFPFPQVPGFGLRAPVYPSTSD